MNPREGRQGGEGVVALRVARVLAVALTVLVTGWGHAYAGRLRRGVACFVGALFAGLGLAAAVARLPPGRSALVLWALGLSAIKAAAAVDAVRSLPPGGVVRPPPTRPQVLVTALLFIAAGELAGLPVRRWALEPFTLPSSSMEPTILAGEHVFVDRTKVHAARGDLVVFARPGAPGDRELQRVVGLPGEQVSLHGGRPSLDGAPVPSCVLGHVHLPSRAREGGDPEPPQDGTVVLERWGARLALAFDDDAPSREDSPPVTVPEEHVFVLGDNRTRARDSRAFGPLPVTSLHGNPFVIWLFGAGNAGEYGRIGIGLDGAGPPVLPVSVVTLFEGRELTFAAGRFASERDVVAGLRVGDASGGPPIGSERPLEPVAALQEAASTASEGRVVEGVEVVAEAGMLGDEGEAEGVEGVDQEVDDDQFGGGEQAPEVVGGHRFRAVAAGFAFGVWANTSRKSFSSRRGSSRSVATARSSSARFMRTR